MALIACPECKQQVSNQAASCPHCGMPIQDMPIVHSADPRVAERFKNPRTGQTVDLERAWLWTLLFGVGYFAVRGIALHAILSLLLAVATSGVSWLIYPFFARRIVRNHLIEHGWLALPRNENS